MRHVGGVGSIDEAEICGDLYWMVRQNGQKERKAKRVEKYVVEVLGYGGVVVLQEISGDGAVGEFGLPRHVDYNGEQESMDRF